MYAAPQNLKPNWLAQLDLTYAKQKGRTIPIVRRHQGPLRVQKHLYEEDAEICQHILIHPPGGIVGGDRLTININLQQQAWALLTNPGATKWYKSNQDAWQKIRCHLSNTTTLEWLPQETIIFNKAQTNIQTILYLENKARCFYWDIIVLGRRESHETFDEGQFQSKLKIYRDHDLIWYEQQKIKGGDALLSSPIGLNDYPVFGTFIMTGSISKENLQQCRALPKPKDLYGDLTQLPHLIIARCLAYQAFTAKNWFIALWKFLRPILLGRSAFPPRIWNT